MSEKIRESGEDLRLARNTLEYFNPTGTMVAVGSVAIIAQLNQAGVEAPISCEDVDVLCTQAYFNSLLRTGSSMAGLDKFQVRWPKGRLKERGATNMSIDLFPESDELLPLTACYSMSDLWYPINYDTALPESTTAGGIRCIPIGSMLEWLSIIGREKDIDTIHQVMPLARDSGLISEIQQTAINRQLAVTEREKALHPERFYARIPEGPVGAPISGS